MFKLSQTEFNGESELKDKLNSEANPDELEQKKSLELQLSKADNLWKQGKISEALELYCQTIELHPNSVELYGQLNALLKYQEELALAYKKLAVQLKQQGEAKEAAICYRQAIVLQAINYGTEEKYLKNHKSELVAQPKLETANLADSAFSFLPLSPSSHQLANRKILQINLDDIYQDNWHDLQAKIQAGSHTSSTLARKTAKTYLQQALEHCESREWPQAVTACQEAIKLTPNLAEAYKIWGNALQRMGKTQEAMDCYSKAVEIQPDLAKVYTRIGNLYAHNKQWQQAVEYYQKAIIIRPNFSQAYLSLAKVWYVIGELEKANFCRQQALKLQKTRINSTNKEAKSFAGGQIATVKLDVIEEYQKTAQKLEKQNKWQEAAVYYRQALELITRQLASASDKSEQDSQHHFQELEKLQQLLENHSTAENNLNNSADFCAQDTSPIKDQEVSPGDFLSTPSVNREPRKVNPEPVELAVESKPSQLNRAIQRYLKQSDLKPDSAKIQIDLGNLYSKKRQWKAAIAAYHKAIEINDCCGQAYLNLAKVLAKIGKNRESVGYMYRALTLKPELFSAKDYFYLGKSFIEQDKLRKGIGYCSKAIKIDPNYLEAYYYLSTVMSQQGEKQKALNCLRQAIKRDPHQPQSHYLLGEELSAQSKWDEAIKAYGQVLAIQPDFPYASEKLNHALAEKLKHDADNKQN
ncbi:MAG: tetratricopeptide repeat protein [Xenococcaceae cyanobacterium]